ncbi:MAG: hypothetical protein VXV98_09475, partial [Candidatus Thermoplasmatota archaeon]|nr:hypothetical protein [Candidatus Thermoplasmatota archaeon]
GLNHACAILDDGDLKCWGWDNHGQLGDGGTNADVDAPSTTAIDLGIGRTAVAVSGGWYHTCAILDNGDLKCWGRDNFGQLGNGATPYSDQSSPQSTAIDLGSGRTAVAVSAGYGHTCAILDNGDLKCWGRDNYGQIGDGGTIGYNDNDFTSGPSEPIDLGTGRTAVTVALGGYHTCAILDDGSVKCWGFDGWGQLGDGGTSTDQASPVSVDLGPGRTAVAISAGEAHTCAILDDGSVKCWGMDNHGQLGDGGTSTDQASPVSVDLGPGRTAVAVSAGESHTCAILDDGSVKCWGSNQWSAIGLGVTEGQQYQPKVYSPTQTASLGTGRTAVAIAVGVHHSCAILDD